MKRIVLILIMFIFSFPILGQEINTYRYVVVPDKFEFTKEADMYKLNSLTEFLFHKYGFDAFLEGEELPEGIKQDRCSALYADVEESSGLFMTRLKVTLKDCRNNVIFVSEEGTSREKDYKAAYHEALRQAFKSIEELNYIYKPESVIASEGVNIEDTAKVTIEKKTVVVTAIPKVPVEIESSLKETTPSNSASGEMKFSKDGLIYNLKKSGKGFDFYQKGMTEPFASLIPSQTNNSFIYSSVKDQGIANFDKNGDLVVEIFERDKNSTQTRVYKREN